MIIISSLFAAGYAYADNDSLKIGVLAKRGAEQAVKQWQPTADYLSMAVGQHTFVVVPLAFDQIRDAVAGQRVDFLLVNSSIYVEMEHDFHVSRIATMKNLRRGKGYSYFGGVVFSRVDHQIDQVAQLRGKSFMAVDPTSFGGAIAAWRELSAHDFDPFTDFCSLQYGRTHDAVVFAVRDGLVDAGTVRTDTLERMADEGKISLADFHVLRLITPGDEPFDFPFLCSTRLYPEWPIANLKHVPEGLAKQVASALFGLDATHPAAQVSRISGWTIPQNYQSVHDCLKELHLGPYSQPLELTAEELFDQYRFSILGFLALLAVTTSAMVYFRVLGQRLQLSELNVREAHAELDQLFHASADGIFRADSEFNIERVNRTFEQMTGLVAQDIVGLKCFDVFPGSACGTVGCPMRKIYAGESQVVDESFKRIKDDREIPCLVFAVPYWDAEGSMTGMVEYVRDISALKQVESDLMQSRDELHEAYQELQRSQSQMLQGEKMATIGQLAAGMAHEINNPIGFIGSNLTTLAKYWDRVAEFIEFQSQPSTFVSPDEVLAKRQQLKIDLIVDDTENLIAESLDGVERVKAIVANLKSFSRLDQAQHDLVDINQCLDATLSIIWNELKYTVTLHKDYGELPLTYCYPQQLNQVFLNLLVNAGQAISTKGDIYIATRCENDKILITIRDNGCGIPEENLSRLFEPFFTTKEVGKGTGLGLSISYDIIKKHHGEFCVDSLVGEGTTFTIKLPVIKAAPQ